MAKNKLLIISGATATGKTGLSIELAKHFPNTFEVVNFDSLLFYKEVNIGTAKPTSKELKEIPHHLINVNSIKNEINANDFVQMAEDKINELHEKDLIPILVGGSTFYLRSLIKGMYEAQTPSQELKDEVASLYKAQGITPFIHFLKHNDSKSYELLHGNDHYRLMRAYEFFKMTGTPISSQKEKFDNENPYDFSQHKHNNWQIMHLSLSVPKEKHWDIMEKRAAQMIEDGLIKEVEDLLEQGFSLKEKPLKSIGYKETIAFLKKTDPEISDIKLLIQRIYINTRRLAKSQKTFLQKVTPKIELSPLDSYDEILEKVKLFLAR